MEECLPSKKKKLKKLMRLSFYLKIELKALRKALRTAKFPRATCNTLLSYSLCNPIIHKIPFVKQRGIF
ncbi:hypothetical protein NEOC95_001571 [Neochlamydia sp. AcF95]|nr:hypothetical protein [Neochlamydia sp. AcF95]